MIQNHKLCLLQCTCLYRLSKGLSRQEWLLVVMQAQGCLSTTSPKKIVPPPESKIIFFCTNLCTTYRFFFCSAVRTQQSMQIGTFESDALKQSSCAQWTAGESLPRSTSKLNYKTSCIHSYWWSQSKTSYNRVLRVDCQWGVGSSILKLTCIHVKAWPKVLPAHVHSCFPTESHAEFLTPTVSSP